MAILDEIKDRKATVGIAGAALIVALVVIWSQTRSTTLKLNHTMFGGIGQVAATETATAVRDHGQILAVIDRSHTIDGARNFDVWQAFQRELKKHAGITLLAPASFKWDLDYGDLDYPRAFKDLMEQYADVDAIVFFVSLPDWNRLRDSQLIPQRLPPQVIVVTTGATQNYYTDYIANGYVTMLIAARRSAAPTKPGGPKTGREWFDAYYQVFTPASFESLTE